MILKGKCKHTFATTGISANFHLVVRVLASYASFLSFSQHISIRASGEYWNNSGVALSENVTFTIVRLCRVGPKNKKRCSAH